MTRVGGGWISAALRLLVRPRLWAAGARLVARIGVKPPGPYIRWRMSTAYGDPDARPSPGDLEGYVDWCRQMDLMVRR